MNVAKWLLYALLVLPLAELAAFIAVVAAVGFLWAAALLLAGSFAGALILRHAGGNIARMRVVLGGGRFTALEADGSGALTLIGGFLLLIPGFITDALALSLLVAPLRRGLASMLRRAATPQRNDVVDLEPEQWHRVPDPALPRRDRDGER
jgi:UPF0716 protein FxsA